MNEDNGKGSNAAAVAQPDDPENPVEDQLVSRLRDLSHTMRALYEGRGSQKRVLIVLEELGGTATQRALTERLGIRSGSASEVIGKLESAGAVERSTSAEDRRNVDVRLTDQGRALAEAARQQRASRHAAMFACLTPEEKAELLALLEKLSGDWALRYPDAACSHGHCHGRSCGCRKEE